MKKSLLLFMFCFVSYSYGQIKLEGFVRDSLGNPLELANITAFKKETNKLESYAISDNEGRFKLNLSKNTRYKVKISYIGMKTFEDSIATGEENFNKNFILKFDNALDAVELTYDLPITIIGDTIVYDADSFKSGTERKLGDILKKLPGVEVDENGEIKVDGNPVMKVMVEGKDFFDGDSKLATKNIPSDAVDKVQVLKNYAEVDQLRGVTDNQDKIAINIKLKEGKKNFWFGDITLGGGFASNEGLYVAQPKLFYYSPKYSINLIGDLNNIGEVAFTRRDYRKFTGGFSQPSTKSGTNIRLGNNNLGFLTLQNNRAKDINTTFGAANFSYSPNKALDISGFAIFTGNRTELQENRVTEYTDSNLGIPNEKSESNILQRTDLGMLKLSAKYKPNPNNQLDYDVLGRLSKESQDQDFLSSVIGTVNQYEETSPYSINQNFNYYYTVNDNNIFAISAQHLLQDEDPFYNAFLANDPTNNDNPGNAEAYDSTALGLGLDRTLSNYDISQNKRVKSNQLDTKLDYWYVLNSKSNINFTIGILLSNQKFNSNIFQTLDNGIEFDPNPTINEGLDINDTEYNFSDMYFGTHYQFKTGIFTITLGFSAHAYTAKNTQFQSEYLDNFFRVLPDFTTNIKLGKSEKLDFNYRMQTEFTDVNQLAEGLVLNSYNRIFSGNQELESALSHNSRLSYSNFNQYRALQIFSIIIYNKLVDQIRTRSNFENVVNTSSPFNSSFSDESLMKIGQIQKSFNKIRATVNWNLNYQKFNQFINGVRSVNENYSQTYNTEIRSVFKNAPNFKLGYQYTIQDNEQGSSRAKFFTTTPSIEFDALLFKKLTFKTKYVFNRFSNEDIELDRFEFWDASLAYRKNKDSKLEYEIVATNMLDTKSQNQSLSSNVSVSATEYFIQPRFVTFRLIYRI